MSFAKDPSPKLNKERDVNLVLLSEIICEKQHVKCVSHSSYESIQEFADLITIPLDYSVEYQLLIETCLTHQCENLYVQNTLVPVFLESHHSWHS